MDQREERETVVPISFIPFLSDRLFPPAFQKSNAT